MDAKSIWEFDINRIIRSALKDIEEVKKREAGGAAPRKEKLNDYQFSETSYHTQAETAEEVHP